MNKPFIECIFKGPGEFVRAIEVYDFIMGIPHSNSLMVTRSQISMSGEGFSNNITCVLTLDREETGSDAILKIKVLMCFFDNDEIVRRPSNVHWTVRYAPVATIVIRLEFDYQCRALVYYDPNSLKDIFEMHSMAFFAGSFLETFWADTVRRWPRREYIPLSDSKNIAYLVPEGNTIVQQITNREEIHIQSDSTTVNVVMPGAQQINQSNGVNIIAEGDVNVGGDVVGRDKINGLDN